MINIFLLIKLIYSVYIFENQLLNINHTSKPIVLNNWNETHVSSFDIGFYIFIQKKLNNINLISLTDYNEFNINIVLNSLDNKILVNNIIYNNSLDLKFFYMNGKINSQNKIEIKFEINEKGNLYSYTYEKDLNNFNFKDIKLILGSDKNMTNFRFIGKISYLSTITNSNSDNFILFKNVNSNIIIYHNFRNNFEKANYFINEAKNGFSGSINGDDIYSDLNNILIKEKILNSNNILVEAYFNNVNSYITLSSDFINYSSSFDKIFYTVYLSLKIDYFHNYNTNLLNYIFYFYFRKNWKFLKKIIDCKNSLNYEYELHISYQKLNYTYLLNPQQIFYLNTIIVKISNISNNKYNINYFIVSKDIYVNQNFVESHTFSKTDKHYIGHINNNVSEIGIKFYIYEVALILGTSLIVTNGKIYTHMNNEKFVLYCDNKSLLIKSRVLDYVSCNNDNETGISTPINHCIIYNNNICYKCVFGKHIVNNNCVDNTKWFYETHRNNYIKIFTKSNLTNNFSHNIHVDVEPRIRKYNFDCDLNFTLLTDYINIQISINTPVKFFHLRSIGTKHNYKILFNLYLNGNNSIEIREFDNTKNFTFKCNIYISELILDNYLITPFENCSKNHNGENYLPKINDLNQSECINKYKIPDNYYLNEKYNIILKCNINCNKCKSNIECLTCKNNFYLEGDICYKNKDINCENPLDHNKCLVCKENSKFSMLDDGTYFCFKSCFNGCNNCYSPLYNECKDCTSNRYLYYPDSKICLYSYTCSTNYSKINNKCIKGCKQYDLNNNCLSCNYLLNLNKELNICMLCSLNDGFFKNYKILDAENRETCKKCNDNCKTCILKDEYCTSCEKNYYLNISSKICINECPKKYYKKNNLCILCNPNCLECDENNINCLKCDNNKLIQSNICVNSCEDTYFLNNINNKCTKCISNCWKCNNKITCVICDNNNYYLDARLGKCSKCNLNNEFIINNTCYKCTENCKTCKNFENFCTSCEKGMILKIFKNKSICIKVCKYNFYFNPNHNRCEDCSNCGYCYKNNTVNCSNCKKCTKKCKLLFIYQYNELVIYNNNKYQIDYNISTQINNINSVNKVKKNYIKFTLDKELKSNLLKISFDTKLIKNSKNCYGLDKLVYYIDKSKISCKIEIFNITKILSKPIIQINLNFLPIKTNNIFEILIENTTRIVKYKIIKTLFSKKSSIYYLRIYPNYYKYIFNINITINKFYLLNSHCALDYLKSKIKINYETKVFKNDIIINKDKFYKTKDFNIIDNIDEVSIKYKKITTSSSSLVLIIVNLLNNGNLIYFFTIVKLVYIIDFILLLPINMGTYVNSFIKYFKLSLDLEFNISKILNIKSPKIIEKYYEDVLTGNSKILTINWINLAYLELDIILIFFLIFIEIILYYLRYFFFLNKKNFLFDLLLKIKITRYIILDSIKPILISILFIYLKNMNKFKLDFNNIKIAIILLIYYIFILLYLYDTVSSIYNLSRKPKSEISKKKLLNLLYYNNIITMKTGKIDKYTLFQIFQIIKEINFILIIFLLKSMAIHSILFLIIQSIFLIYVFSLDINLFYYKLIKIRFEELINFILIISLILNYYFGLKQFQLSFIIFYILLFLINLLVIIFNIGVTIIDLYNKYIVKSYGKIKNF